MPKAPRSPNRLLASLPSVQRRPIGLFLAALVVIAVFVIILSYSP
jgi:hypothetical protein